MFVSIYCASVIDVSEQVTYEDEDVADDDELEDYDSSDPYGWNRDSCSELRSRAEKYYPTWNRNIYKAGKISELTREEAIEMMEGDCFYCNRKHIPGVNEVQTIDRIVSSIPVYSMKHCVPACKWCNSAKMWLDNCEFKKSILGWNDPPNLRRSMDLCGIESVRDLDALAAREPEGTGLHITGSRAMTPLRKGLDQLMENPRTRAMLQRIMLSPCYLCGESVANGLDRLYSDESYIMSLLNNRLLACCLPCNIIKGDNDLKTILVQMRRIHNNITSDAFLNKKRKINEELARLLMSEELLDQNLKHGHHDRFPVQTEINGQTMVFPSIYSLEKFELHSEVGTEGLLLERVPISNYRRFQETASSEAVREALRIPGASPFEFDEELTTMLVCMESEAERLDKEHSESKKNSQIVNRPSKSSRIHRMSFKNRSISNDSDDLDLEDKPSHEDLDRGDDPSSGVGVTQRLVYTPRKESVAARVEKRCRELATKLEDLRFSTCEDAPYYDDHTKHKKCRVSYFENGEWKQCPTESQGSKNEYLCKAHYKICSSSDDSKYAHWRMSKWEECLTGLRVKASNNTPYHDANHKKKGRKCRASILENGKWKQCPGVNQGSKHAFLCKRHCKICSELDSSDDAKWRNSDLEVQMLPRHSR